MKKIVIFLILFIPAMLSIASENNMLQSGSLEPGDLGEPDPGTVIDDLFGEVKRGQSSTDTPNPRQVSYSLNDDISRIDWPFLRTTIGTKDNDYRGWYKTNGDSPCHYGDDAFAQDWHYGRFAEDIGLTVYASFPGWVVHAEQLDDPESTAAGNIVVIRSRDRWHMFMRYAHLHTVSVEVGDYVHFGSEIGTVGATGYNVIDKFAHLHFALYKNVLDVQNVTNLYKGLPPGGGGDICDSSTAPSKFAAQFIVDGIPVSDRDDEEDLPCNVWNFNYTACDTHSIEWGDKETQDCAYYSTGICAPRGTSNCRAHHEDQCNGSFDNDDDEFKPCSTWDGNKDACDAHKIKPNGTRDCAYYAHSQKCRPKGTSNCLAGIEPFCSN